MTRHYSPHSPYSPARAERESRPRADYPGHDEPPSYAPYTGADHPGYRQYATTTLDQDTHRDRGERPTGYPDYRSHEYGGHEYGSYEYGGGYRDRAYDARSPRTGDHAADGYADDHADDYDVEDYEAYVTTIDGRWKWIAGVAGGILLVAVICTVVILGGGDSGPVSATVASPTQSPTQAPAPSTAAAPHDTAAPLPPPVATLAPETVTTVTPTAPAETVAPAPAPSAIAPPPPPAANPRAITYTVTGNRQLIDLVTVIYTDQQGALQTEVNVALPWSRTVVLDPGVELKSVTATSVGGQLNCAVTDAAGTVLVAQNNNSMIATCTQ